MGKIGGKFVKKPVVVDAINYTGANAFEIIEFTKCQAYTFGPNDNDIEIPTLEGNHRCRPGDWVIRGIQGEYYPCKPDIFNKTYNPA
jgi:hypothetical protein